MPSQLAAPGALLLAALCALCGGSVAEGGPPDLPARERTSPSIDHPTVHPGITFQDGKATVIGCVVDGAGDIPDDGALLDAVIKFIGEENVDGRVGTFAFRATLNHGELLRAANHPSVHSLEANWEFRATVTDAVEIVHAVEAWESQIAGAGLRGEDQTIAIFDTGIDFSHPDLAAKNIFGCELDCVTGTCIVDCALTDCHGHGTHVAGVAGAAGAIEGVAPGVNLIALRMFPDCGAWGAIGLNVLDGMQWCIDHKDEYNISAMSMSLGTLTRYATQLDCDTASPSFVLMIEAANEAGIALIAATANDFDDAAIALPACISGAIAVAATNKDDTLAAYSNYNETVRLFAPGTDILSTCLESAYCEKTGTSMSTPMVAGAFAIINQFLNGIEESMTPAEIEQLLFDTGDPIVDMPFEQWRRINIQSAINALRVMYITADLSGDGLVDAEDLSILLGAWGPYAPCPPLLGGDLDWDCDVDAADLAILLGEWE